MNQPNRRESSFRKAADDYAGKGFSVLPCGRDKRPLLPTWAEFQRRPPTATELDEWAKADPDANVALVCGRLSDLTVVDCDTAEAIEAVEALIPDTCNVPVTTTPRGGRHYHFRFTPGLVSRTTAKNIDVKTEGGYILAPPSRTDKGSYAAGAVAIDERPMMPEALVAFLWKGQGAPSSGGRLAGGDWAADIPQGERDAEMTRRAGKLIGPAGMPPAEALDVLLAVNERRCKPPLDDAQVRKIVASIASREARAGGDEGRAGPARMKMERFRDILRQYCRGEEESWLIKDWLPKASCGLLVGAPKNFKTWASLDLAVSVMTGRPFLGQYPVTNGGPVLMVQQEDPFKTLAARTVKMFNSAPSTEAGEGASKTYQLDYGLSKKLDDLPFYWITSRDFSFHDKTAMELLERRIAEARPVLTIIDPLYVAAGGRSEDFFAKTAAEMNQLKRLRDVYGSGFLVIHHTTWSGRTSEDIAGMWGSIYLFAWLEFGWTMIETDKKSEGKVRIRRYFKESQEPPIIQATFTIDDQGYAVETGEDDASINKKIEEAILAGGHFETERALAKAVGCSPYGAHRAMKKMGLAKDEEGCYKIPSR